MQRSFRHLKDLYKNLEVYTGQQVILHPDKAEEIAKLSRRIADKYLKHFSFLNCDAVGGFLFDKLNHDIKIAEELFDDFGKLNSISATVTA